MAQTTKQQKQQKQGDGYSDMPLNTRQQSAVFVIKQWNPVESQHIKCVKTAITVISNVLYKPTQEKYHKLRLDKPKVKKTFIDVIGGIKLLKLAGFQQTTENNVKTLTIEAPSTIEEFEQLTDIWLVLLKTQYIWGINPDPNAPKQSALPAQFKIPNTLQHGMLSFFKSNDIAQSAQFQEYVKQSNDAQLSPHALQRYSYFARAIEMVSKSQDLDFFDMNATHGLNDIDASDVAALIISEILCGYYDEDEAYTSLILAEDLRIMAEQQQQQQEQEEEEEEEEYKMENTQKIVTAQYSKNARIVFCISDSELKGRIRWIGECDKWEDGTWYGVELERENVVYGHNGYFNEERFFGCVDYHGIYIRETQIICVIKEEEEEEETKEEDAKRYIIVDIGCGWGNLGRLLLDKEVRPYLNEIEKESELKKVHLYGVDVSSEMIGIATNENNRFDRYYADMIVMDCQTNQVRQFRDGTVDIVTSTNCLMQDKKLGHPNETFLIEANRLLKVNGWCIVTRRFHGVHLGLQLYAYLMIAQQLGWKNVFASRIREIFFIGWQKMPKPL